MASPRVSSAPATHSSLPPFWTAGELAVKPREFSAFQWACGFAEALSVIPPRSPVEEHGNSEAKDDSSGGAGPGGGSPNTSSSSSPALPTLKFKGWEKGPRNSPGNARRVAKALSGVIPDSSKIHFFNMGRGGGGEAEEDSELDTPAIKFHLPGFGFVSASLDIVLVKASGSVRRPPPHNGLTMLDDALAVIECDSGDHLAFDSASPGISRRHLRQLYTKTVLIHLLREKPLPVYLTDFEAGAVKASVVSGPRGVPLVIYERLTSEGFVKELQHGQRKPALTAKTMSAVRRFKYGWCLLDTRTRPPFALDGREAKKASEGKEEDGVVTDVHQKSGGISTAGGGGEKKIPTGASGSKKTSPSSTATTATSQSSSFSPTPPQIPSTSSPSAQGHSAVPSHHTPSHLVAGHHYPHLQGGGGGDASNASVPLMATHAAGPAPPAASAAGGGGSTAPMTPKKRTRKPREVPSTAASAGGGSAAPNAVQGPFSGGAAGVGLPGAAGGGGPPGTVKVTGKGEKSFTASSGGSSSAPASSKGGGSKKQKVAAVDSSGSALHAPGAATAGGGAGGEGSASVGGGGGGTKGRGGSQVAMHEQLHRGGGKGGGGRRDQDTFW